MPISADDNPKEFLTIAVAAGMLIFANKSWSVEDYLNTAEKFVAAVESRYGKLNKK